MVAKGRLALEPFLIQPRKTQLCIKTKPQRPNYFVGHSSSTQNTNGIWMQYHTQKTLNEGKTEESNEQKRAHGSKSKTISGLTLAECIEVRIPWSDNFLLSSSNIIYSCDSYWYLVKYHWSPPLTPGMKQIVLPGHLCLSAATWLILAHELQVEAECRDS